MKETDITDVDVTGDAGWSYSAHVWGGPSPDTLARISAASQEIGAVAKGDRAQHGGGFNFRGIDAVVNASYPAFRNHGIVVSPTVFRVDRTDVPTRSGNTAHVVTLEVEYRFYGPDGTHLSSRVASEAFDSGDKATAKAMSVAYRTALLQVLHLPTDEPDPDSQAFERAAAVPPAEQIRLMVNGVKELLVEKVGPENAKSAYDDLVGEYGVPDSVADATALRAAAEAI